MRKEPIKYDIYQLRISFLYSLLTSIMERNTTEIELIGIKIAAIKGVKFPVIAIDNPIKL